MNNESRMVEHGSRMWRVEFTTPTVTDAQLSSVHDQLALACGGTPYVDAHQSKYPHLEAQRERARAFWAERRPFGALAPL
jgi:hypothetical protein